VLFTDMNPFSTLVGSIKWMQTKKDLKFCNAKLSDELPMVSLFYFIMLAMLVSGEHTNFVPLDWFLPIID